MRFSRPDVRFDPWKPGRNANHKPISIVSFHPTSEIPCFYHVSHNSFIWKVAMTTGTVSDPAGSFCCCTSRGKEQTLFWWTESNPPPTFSAREGGPSSQTPTPPFNGPNPPLIGWHDGGSHLDAAGPQEKNVTRPPRMPAIVATEGLGGDPNNIGIVHRGKNRWHTYHVLVYISPVSPTFQGLCHVLWP